MQRNLRTLYIHHTFSSLRPLLSPWKLAGTGKFAEGGEALSSAKSLGGARLSVPMVELMIHAVEGVRVLCEEVTVTGSDVSDVLKVGEDGGGGGEFLTPQNLDLGCTYSSWQCVQLIITYLPLLDHLFSLIAAAFKKVQNHVSVVLALHECMCALLYCV